MSDDDMELQDNHLLKDEPIQRGKIEISDSDEDEPIKPPAQSSGANLFDSLKSDDSPVTAVEKKKPKTKKGGGGDKAAPTKRPRKKGSSSDESSDDFAAKKKVMHT